MNGNRDLLLLQKVMNEPIYDNQCPEYIISIGNFHLIGQTVK